MRSIHLAMRGAPSAMALRIIDSEAQSCGHWMALTICSDATCKCWWHPAAGKLQLQVLSLRLAPPANYFGRQWWTSSRVFPIGSSLGLVESHAANPMAATRPLGRLRLAAACKCRWLESRSPVPVEKALAPRTRAERRCHTEDGTAVLNRPNRNPGIHRVETRLFLSGMFFRVDLHCSRCFRQRLDMSRR